MAEMKRLVVTDSAFVLQLNTSQAIKQRHERRRKRGLSRKACTPWRELSLKQFGKRLLHAV